MVKIPIIRKVHNIRGSKFVALPKSWIEYHERIQGEEIKEVAMDVSDVIVIRPISKKKGGS